MKTNLLPLAKEGITYFLISLSFFILFFILDYDFLAFVLFFVTLFIFFVFRNPERELSVFDQSSLLSPVDGIIESIEELENDKYVYKIEIQGSYRDVGVLRVPAYATVTKLIKRNGTRVSKTSKLFTSLNEYVEINFTTKEENSFKVLHRLKQSFAPLYIRLKEEKSFAQTARYGMMLNGATTIYLPQNFRMSIAVGSELKASESLMGYFS